MFEAHLKCEGSCKNKADDQNDGCGLVHPAELDKQMTLSIDCVEHSHHNTGTYVNACMQVVKAIKAA